MWTITRLPSQARTSTHNPADRAAQIRRERLEAEQRLLHLSRKANGIPDPATWMW